MGNCLIAKLKGEVINDNLPVLNGLKVRFYKSEGTVDDKAISFKIQMVGNVVIYTDNNHGFQVGGGAETNRFEGTLSGWTTIKGQNDNFSIVIKPSSALKDISNVSGDDLTDHNYGFDIDEASDCASTLTVYNNTKLKGQVRVVNCVTLSINNTNAFVDFDNVVFAKENGYIGRLDLADTPSKGNISNNVSFARWLGTSTKPDTVVSLERTAVTGDATILAAAIASFEKNSGYVRLYTPTTVTKPSGIGNNFYIYFGTGMEGHNPTQEETEQGWCIR